MSHLRHRTQGTPLLVTLRTDKRLFASVKSTMTHQIATLFELLVTLWTDKRLFNDVNSTMTDQLATFFELLVTLGTDKRLFTSVKSKMTNHSPLCLNFLSHSGQTNGFSPM
jgi:hypothetical protein